MRRREFITLLGGAAAASPLAGRAQQPAMPVIGFLGGGSPDPFAATVIALLVNPSNPLGEAVSKDLQAAARILGLQVHVFHASTELDFDAVFTALAQLRAAALVIGSADPFFGSRAAQLGALALRHAVPAIYQFREFAEAGGLVSYGGRFRTPTVRSGYTRGASSKARSPPTCRSSSPQKSS